MENRFKWLFQLELRNQSPSERRINQIETVQFVSVPVYLLVYSGQAFVPKSPMHQRGQMIGPHQLSLLLIGF